MPTPTPSSYELSTKPELHTEVHSDEDNTHDLPSWRIMLVAISLLLGLFLSLMDTSIVATAIFTITREYNSLGDVTWIILAYTLTYVGFAVIVNRLADVVGRKIAVLSCFIIFVAMSIGCGFSQTLNALIACRAIQGIGGSGLYSLALVILPEISPAKYLSAMSALIGLTVALAGVLGPVLGGVITQNTTWRWIFWLNGPVGIVPLIIFFIACPRHTVGHDFMKRRFRDVDFVGCVLLLASTILFIFGLQEGGIGAYPWSSPIIICTILFACVSGLILAAWEVFVWRRYGEKVAMIVPTKVVTNRVMVAALFSTLCTGFSMFVCIFNIPLRFQIVNLKNPAEAGVRLLPMLGSGAVGTIIGGMSSLKKNHTFMALLSASALIIIGDGLLSTLSNDVNPKANVYGYEVIFGVGYGIALTTATILTTLHTDMREHAVAQGLLGQARIFGGSIGIAASSAVFNAQIHQKLSDVLTPEQVTGLQTSFSSIVSELSLTQLEAIRETFAESFNQSLRICTYIAAVGFVAALFVYQRHPPQILVKQAEFLAELEQFRKNADSHDREEH